VQTVSSAVPVSAIEFTQGDGTTCDFTATLVARSPDGESYAVDLRGSWSRTGGVTTELRAPAATNAIGTLGSAVMDRSGATTRVRWTGPAGKTARVSVILNVQRAAA
jgi:hypothetical protein